MGCLVLQLGDAPADPEGAQEQVRGRHQRVLVEEGELDAAAADVDDGRAGLDRPLEVLALGRDGLVA